MITTEYIPINKKKYVNHIIKLEAENKALKEKLKTYEKFMNIKIKKIGENILNNKYNENLQIKKSFCDIKYITETNSTPSHDIEFKKNISLFMQSPENNQHLIEPIINHLTCNKINASISQHDVISFLTDI
jgi:hypothetical protein